MNGSEKQIKWAEQIKAEKIQEANSKIEKMIKDYPDAPVEQIEKIKRQHKDVIESFENQNDAKFWIDNRGLSFRQIAKDILKIK